jgi:hypothetical protein
MASAVLFDRHPLVRTVRWRTVAKVLSIGLDGAPCQGALFSPVETRAGELSLQPEAFGAGQEATNDLKHPENEPLMGVGGPCGPQHE